MWSQQTPWLDVWSQQTPWLYIWSQQTNIFINIKLTLGLRSDNQLELAVPITHLVTYGDRAFSAAAANLWNSIPVAIRLCNTVTTFKICIKIYLFNQWFNQTQNILCWQVLFIKCDGCGCVFYPNFILCLWVLQKKRYINLTLYYITILYGIDRNGIYWKNYFKDRKSNPPTSINDTVRLHRTKHEECLSIFITNCFILPCYHYHAIYSQSYHVINHIFS